jgi:hypothetical protein
VLRWGGWAFQSGSPWARAGSEWQSAQPEANGRSLAEAAAGLGKLHAHLVFARRQHLRGLNVEVFHFCTLWQYLSLPLLA